MRLIVAFVVGLIYNLLILHDTVTVLFVSIGTALSLGIYVLLDCRRGVQEDGKGIAPSNLGKGDVNKLSR